MIASGDRTRRKRFYALTSRVQVPGLGSIFRVYMLNELRAEPN